MQVAFKGFIDNKWGPENFYPAILNTVGSLTLARAFIGSANNVGSPNPSSLVDLKVEHFHSGLESRRLYRESWLSSIAVAVWNAVETIFYIPIAALAFLLADDKRFTNLAQKSFVQCLTNTIAASIGFVGQFTPTHAGKIYVTAMKCLLMLEPTLFTICNDEYSKNTETLFAGIAKCFDTTAEEAAVRKAWSATTCMVSSAQTQVIEIAENLMAAGI